MSDYAELEQRLTRYDTSMFLGRLLWYSITEASVIDHTDFCRLLIENNIDEILPFQPRPSDVFRRVASSERTKTIATSGSPHERYWFTEVDRNEDQITRVLVVETVDQAGKVVDHEQFYRVQFDKTTNQITSEQFKGVVPSDFAKQRVASLQAEFTAMANMLTAYTVREHVRKIITKWGATVVRPAGGVYFVQEAFADKVEALSTVVDGLGPGSILHYLPLLDDRKQREMLKAAFMDESIGEVEGMVAEMGAIMKAGKKITTDRMVDFQLKHRALKAKVAEYSELLKDGMDGVDSHLKVMDEVLWALVAHVK